jgi:hypothetical protein
LNVAFPTNEENNAGKVEEFRDLLNGCGWEIIAPSDVGLEVDVEETGTTYAENATLKAKAFGNSRERCSRRPQATREVFRETRTSRHRAAIVS